MEYCHYHPLEAATFRCSECGRTLCDQCVDVDRRVGVRCYCSQKPLDSLGARHTAEPFWRRLKQSFHYPKKPEIIVLLVLISFLSTLSLLYIPFGFVWALMMSGAFIKYCMSALEKTALGTMEAPDITEAYGGGISLLLQLLFVLLVLAAVVIAGGMVLGPTFAGLLGVGAMVILPAMLINFAMTENIWQAINIPASIRLIRAVGLPYGLLLALIVVMMSSTALLSGLLLNQPGLWSLSLQSLVSNYYLLVTCHLMGYMLFQYQHELGFQAREASIDDLPIPSERQRLSVQIDQGLKNADFDQVLTLFSKGLRQYPDDQILFDQGFEFLCASKNTEQLGNFSERYFTHLKASLREDKARLVFKRIQTLLPKYLPDSPISRHIIAKSCYEAGDHKSVVMLLNGLHKQYPDYFDLPSAYELLAKALENIPNLSAHAPKYRTLATKLKNRKPQQAKNPASFSISAPEKLNERPNERPTQSNTDAVATSKVASKPSPKPRASLGEGLSLAPIEKASSMEEGIDSDKQINLLDDRSVQSVAKDSKKKVRAGGPQKSESLEEIFASRAQKNKPDDV